MNIITGNIDNALSSRISKSENSLNKINNSSFEAHLNEARKVSKEVTPGTKSPVHKKLWETCIEVESLFVAKMFKEMRSTVDKSEWMNGGFAEEIFEDMLYDEYALQLSKNSSIGMAKLVYDEMSRNILGITAGMVSAVRQNTWVDYLVMSVAVIGITIPLFVIGPVLAYIFAMKLGWLPSSGWITGRYGWVTLIMPVITLSADKFAYIARLSRASILEILRSDYIRTAKAKGLKTSTILVKHVLKGGLLPVVSYLGPAFSAILTGSIVVETVFRVPGLGKFFVQSALNRDYTLILGTVIVYSVILIIMNFVVDIIYAYLDPRISYK